MEAWAADVLHVALRENAAARYQTLTRDEGGTYGWQGAGPRLTKQVARWCLREVLPFKDRNERLASARAQLLVVETVAVLGGCEAVRALVKGEPEP